MPKSVHTVAYGAFRKQMVAARRAAGLTQQQLATRLRRPQSFVAKYERGERRLDLVEFLQIAAALRADVRPIIRAVVAEL